MRDIGGQFLGVTFTDLGAGVKGGAPAAFQSSYAAQLAAAPPRIGFFQNSFSDFLDAKVDLLESGTRKTKRGPRGGDEHVGVTLGSGDGTLGELKDPISLPAGASFGFAYSFDSFVAYLAHEWNLFQTGSQGRVTPFLEQDPNGPVILESLDFYGSNDGSQLLSVTSGRFPLPSGLPDVTFSLTTTETGRVHASAGDIQAVSVDVETRLDKDTSELDADIQKLQALGGLLAPTIPWFSLGAIAGAVVDGERYVQSLLQALTVQPFTFLPFVVSLFPVRTLLPGTTDRIVYPYSGFSVPTGGPKQNGAPKGFGALARFDTSGAKTFLPRGAFTAFGTKKPRRVARQPTVWIGGPSPVYFPQNPSRAGARVTAKYSAIVNDEAVPPVDLTWGLTIGKKTKSTSAFLWSNKGEAVTLEFDDAGVTATPPDINVTLSVVMVDAVGQKVQNHYPSAGRPIEATSPPTGGNSGGGGGHGTSGHGSVPKSDT